MKRMIAAAMTATAVCIVLAGCMSDREFILRQKDIEAKKAWPATYQPVVIKGPVTIPEGGEMVVTVPNQPYQNTPIPNGQEIQANLAKDIIHTGAIVGGAAYSIRHANGSTTNNTTINNNAGGAAE